MRVLTACVLCARVCWARLLDLQCLSCESCPSPRALCVRANLVGCVRRGAGGACEGRAPLRLVGEGSASAAVAA